MAASTPAVLRILWTRFAWRHWRLAPVSSLLLLLILSFGVAAFFSIRLANRAAVASFENFTGIITSQSDGIITAPVGTLPDSERRPPPVSVNTRSSTIVAPNFLAAAR